MNTNSKKEVSLFLQLISTPDDPSITLSGCDMDKIVLLAKRHKLMVQLLQFVKLHSSYFTTEQISCIEEHSRGIALYSLKQLMELQRIAAAFQAQNLPFVAIKGPQLSRMIYGREALKDSVDLDLMLVNVDDLPAVHTLLTNSGYTRSNLNDYPGSFRRKLFLIAKREIFYYNSGLRIAIDLHIRPGANTYLTAHRFDDFFQHLKPFDLEGTTVTVLSDEAYFVYLCYHGALHQFSRLAWLADIRAFLKIKSSAMDENEIRTIAEKWRVIRCVALALRLIREYFGEEYIPFKQMSSFRLNYISSSCRYILNRKSGYGTTIPGRISKTVYIMALLEGMAARADWVYGMVMRKLVPVLAKKTR